MKKLLLATAVAVLAFASSSTYAVTCIKSGYIERVDTTATTSTIYIKLNSTTGAFFKATSADPKIVSAAQAALTSRTWTQITTNPATCPTASGSSIGGIVSLIVAP